MAAHSSPAGIESTDWRPTALMSLVRALIVDLLQATGMSRLDARAALTDTWGRPFADARIGPERPVEDGVTRLTQDGPAT